MVWGAGGKGKALAQLLIEQNIEFQWICDNPKKIGKDIYDQKILSFNELDNINGAQSIVTVANPKAQLEIKKYFEDRNQVLMRDFFFFC